MSVNGKFLTAYNLTKRANAKADQLEITGLAKMIFVFIAISDDASFLSIIKKFNKHEMMEIAQSMVELVNNKAIYQLHTSERYYAVAI